jgi:hypothetical protein
LLKLLLPLSLLQLQEFDLLGKLLNGCIWVHVAIGADPTNAPISMSPTP